MRRAGRQAARVRAALLLEVVVALTVLVAVLGLLGAQLVNGLKMLDQARQRYRATQLVERPLMKLDLDDLDVEQFLADREAQGDFDVQYPGWFWRATADETDIPGLWQVTLEILHAGDPQLADDIDSARVVQTVHLLKAQPVRVNLVRDFGLSEEQAQQLADALPVDFDPLDFNPAEIANALDAETLLEAMPALMPLMPVLVANRSVQPPPGVTPVSLGGSGSPGQAGGAGALAAGPNRPAGGATAAGGQQPGAGGSNGLSNLDALVRQFLPGAGDAEIAAIRDLIAQQIGDQIPPEQLNALLGMIGPMLQANGGQIPPGLIPPDLADQLGGLDRLPQLPGGGRGGRGARGGRGGQRTPLTLEDLNRIRNERNRRGNP